MTTRHLGIVIVGAFGIVVVVLLYQLASGTPTATSRQLWVDEVSCSFRDKMVTTVPACGPLVADGLAKTGPRACDCALQTFIANMDPSLELVTVTPVVEIDTPCETRRGRETEFEDCGTQRLLIVTRRR